MEPEPAPREFTRRAVIAGLIGGIVFGSANAYLGLRVGLTVGTSIPIAILSVAAFRLLINQLGKVGILEVNIAQTVGSASSSLATGLIFTVPAIYLWGERPSFVTVTFLAMAGGLLGTLAMIPLRRFLIVRAHGELPYPEGTACAEVLKAADSGGNRARRILAGLGIGALFKLLADALKLIPREIAAPIPALPAGQLTMEPSGSLLGIGYILGYRVSGVMVGGGLLASAVLIPLIAQYGNVGTDPDVIWSKHVRFIGAGAVAMGGILTVIRSLPVMIESFRLAVGGFADATKEAVARQDRDLSMRTVGIGCIVIVLALAIAPGLLGTDSGFGFRVVGAIAIAVFSFFFATVASRIVGMLGTTSNPVSGMTIVTMLGTTGVLLLLGHSGLPGQLLAITIGTVVCTAASIAGDMSQDLKTGYLVGATPRNQQIGHLISPVVAAPFIAGTVLLLASQGGIGTQEMPAPQATLLKTVIEGVLSRDLPWALVLTGAALALVAAAVGVPALAFAVGIYLPLATMSTIFVGGCLRALADRRLKERAEGGVLFASGLVAGESILGVGIAGFAFVWGKPGGLGLDMPPSVEPGIGIAAVLAIAWLLYRSAASADEASA